MQCTWALYTEYRYAWTPLIIGMSIFALGLSISLTQGFILPRLVQKLAPGHIIVTGLLIGLSSMLVIALSPSGAVSLAMVCLFAVMGIVGPTIQGLISRRCEASTQGVNMGAVSSLNSFTGAISPLIGTPLLMITADHHMHPVLAGAPYLATVLLIACALALTLKTNVGGD